MYIDDIKLFAKNEKRIGNPNTKRENTKSKYRNGIWHRKMHHASYKEEDFPVLKTALTHRYDDSKTTLKSSEED